MYDDYYWSPPIPMDIWPPQQRYLLERVGALNLQLFVQYNIFGGLNGRFGLAWMTPDLMPVVRVKIFGNVFVIPFNFLDSLYAECYNLLLQYIPPPPPIE